MLNGATLSASAMVGTAVFRIVVSSDSIKKATATSQGNNRLLEARGNGAPMESSGFMFWVASEPSPRDHGTGAEILARTVHQTDAAIAVAGIATPPSESAGCSRLCEVMSSRRSYRYGPLN